MPENNVDLQSVSKLSTNLQMFDASKVDIDLSKEEEKFNTKEDQNPFSELPNEDKKTGLETNQKQSIDVMSELTSQIKELEQQLIDRTSEVLRNTDMLREF